MMKRIIGGAMLLAFATAIVGCEADARIDSNRTNSSGSYEKKTTTVQEPNGDVHTRTDVEHNP